MVQARRVPVFHPAFGMISAVAAILLLIVFLGDLLFIPEYIGMFPVSKAQVVAEQPAAVEISMEDEALIFPTDQVDAEIMRAQTEAPAGMGGIDATPAADLAQKSR
jgi:hypothetical protein